MFSIGPILSMKPRKIMVYNYKKIPKFVEKSSKLRFLLQNNQSELSRGFYYKVCSYKTKQNLSKFCIKKFKWRLHAQQHLMKKMLIEYDQPGVAVAGSMIRRSSKQILLLRRKRDGKYSFIGGHLINTDTKSCLLEKFRQKLGVDLKIAKIYSQMEILDPNQDFHYFLTIYIVEQPWQQPISNLRPDKYHEFVWADEQRIKQLASQNLLFHGLKQIVSNQEFSKIFE